MLNYQMAIEEQILFTKAHASMLFFERKCNHFGELIT